MEKKFEKRRVLARHLARELTQAELNRIAGRGTSYYGTGQRGPAGQYDDIWAGDCIDGPDILY